MCSNLAFISFLQGSFTSTGLVVSSKLPRFSDMYTLTIESADPKSVSANEPVHLTKSVTQWYFSSSLHLLYNIPYIIIHTDTGHVNSNHACIDFLVIEMHQSVFCLDFRFTKDGVLVEGLFWKEVEALIAQYTKEPKKSK